MSYQLQDKVKLDCVCVSGCAYDVAVNNYCSNCSLLGGTRAKAVCQEGGGGEISVYYTQ